jgi:hypothetical protein
VNVKKGELFFFLLHNRSSHDEREKYQDISQITSSFTVMVIPALHYHESPCQCSCKRRVDMPLLPSAPGRTRRHHHCPGQSLSVSWLRAWQPVPRSAALNPGGRRGTGLKTRRGGGAAPCFLRPPRRRRRSVRSRFGLAPSVAHWSEDPGS